jgi:hypothetical protein
VRETMRSLESIRTDLAHAETELSAARHKADVLRNEEVHYLSVRWIEANVVTLDQIHHPKEADGWIGSVDKFREWLASLPSRKRFACWNTILYQTDDLIANGLRQDATGRIENVPGYSKDHLP